MGPGVEEPDEVVSAGQEHREEGGRQSGDGVEHGGEDVGFCSEAKGSL